MSAFRFALLAAVGSVAVTATATAAVLCRKRSGAVFVRGACKKKETPLDLAQFGGIGPKGDKGDPGAPGVGPLTMCPPDSVLVGTTCVDTYEASVWQIAPANTALLQKVQAGNVTLADLTSGGATQLGCSAAPFNQAAYPTSFPQSGQWTPVPGSSPPSPGVYAVSVAGVLPSNCITWFQAAQACRLSGKRLLTNLEWQDAAAGTPDPGTDDGTSDCNISTTSNPVNTGSRARCKSSWGTFDMVGNTDEWVADWGERATMCATWPAGFGGDYSCMGGNDATHLPGTLIRGGFWTDGTSAGVFAVTAAFILPSDSSSLVGFRCAR